MTEFATLSHRKKLRFYGWGYADDVLSPDEDARIRRTAAHFNATLEQVAAPRESDILLRAPRLAIPDSLASMISVTQYDRLVHSLGKSFADIARMFLRDVPEPPDLVAFPKSENDVVDLLDWASRANVAAIPFGGGSSVAGGVEPDVGDSYAGTISIDLQFLNKVLEIDRASRAARIQAGALGPELEEQLKPHGLTLRHFPQSLQISTLGGWIATRSGGHYASLYTHIDDFVELTRTVTPAGVLETRRLPGSGAGPSPDRMIIGSEGVLGVITGSVDARAGPSHLPGIGKRPISHDGARHCRRPCAFAIGSVPHQLPAARSGRGPQQRCRRRHELRSCVLGFESADHPLDAWMTRALELVADHHGIYDAEAVARSLKPKGGEGEHRQGAAGQWRNAFIRMPYYRDLLISLGIISDTFETSITWDRFDHLYENVREKTSMVLREVCGHDATVSCRFTHIYPDGPAPYFSYSALGTANGDLRSSLAKWRDIKQATNEIVVGARRNGDTSPRSRP